MRLVHRYKQRATRRFPPSGESTRRGGSANASPARRAAIQVLIRGDRSDPGDPTRSGRFPFRSVRVPLMKVLLILALMWLLSGAVAAMLSFGPPLARLCSRPDQPGKLDLGGR